MKPYRTGSIALRLCLTLLLAACGGTPPSVVAPSSGASAADAGAAGAPIALAPSKDENDLPVPIGPDDATRGKRDALVTIVVFDDFQCPFCSRLARTLGAVSETYGDDVRIVWKHHPLPFHPHAELAAEIGEGVRATKGNDAFWRYHDLAFSRQPQMNPATLQAWAVAAGADGAELEAGLERHTWKPKVERDIALAAQVGAVGTPAMRINGVPLEGAQPIEKLKPVIDAEIEKAKALLARNVARDTIYRVLVTENYTAPKKEEVPRDDTTTRWRVSVGNAPIRGPKDAPVTIVEFGDFQCVYCKKSEATLAELRKTYGNKLRIVWKDGPLPFHLRAMPAAEVAREARAQKGDAGFWDVHDKLYASMKPGDGAFGAVAVQALDDADLEAVAKSAGLDVGKLKASLKSGQYRKSIEADVAEAKALNATGTPQFFLNGRRLIGAQSIDRFQAIIDEEIKSFDQQKGKVAAKDYYGSLMANAAPPAPPFDKTLAQPVAVDLAPVVVAPATGSGALKIEELAAGSGAEIKAGDTALVQYTGTLLNGTEFDSSRKYGAGQPFKFKLGMGRVIKGWEQGVVGMKVGGKRKLTVPPDLAYGERGAGSLIPPRSTLVFEVELVGIE